MTTAKKLLTAEEFLLDSNESKTELIDGSVWSMPPTKPVHGRTQAAFSEQLGAKWGKKPGGKVPGGWWFATEIGVRYGRNHVLCHDLAGWRRDRLPKWPTDLSLMEMRPDWVCEILSSNIRDDKVRKHRILHEWEVPYYWLVDPVDLEIRILQRENEDFKVFMDVGTDFVGFLPPFEGEEISVKDLFGLEE